MRFRFLMLACLAAMTAVLSPARAATFTEWAAVVVAGDNVSAENTPSPVFDNGRRAIVEALVKIGFLPVNIGQFSVDAEVSGDGSTPSTFIAIGDGLESKVRGAQEGCLLYITSHGLPDGILVGQTRIRPGLLNLMLNRTCGERPTIVILSACYSGLFVPELQGPNRMILTASRFDRTSFGCGAADMYTFFDSCIVEMLPQSYDFPDLALRTQTCIARRERAEKATPPSEPQLAIGANMNSVLSERPFPRKN